MKKIFSTITILAFIAIPVIVFAGPGHAEGTPHVETQGTVHVHEDGTVEAHNDGGFELATPWSPRWWMLMGTSLILMGFLSMYVQKYLKVE